MGTELDVFLEPGAFQQESRAALALVLDGRESASAPTWKRSNSGSLSKFHIVHPGPLLLYNDESITMSVFVGHTDTASSLADWIEIGDSPGVVGETFSLPAKGSKVITPRKTFVGIKTHASLESGHPRGVIQPLGILLRGPSALTLDAPFILNLS